MQYISNSAYKPFLGHTEYAGVDKIRIQYPLDVEYSDGSSDLFTKHGVHKTLSRGGELQYARGSIPGPRGDNLYFEVRNNASTAVIEFNPSRTLDPNGSTLCQPNKVEDLVVGIIQFLADHTVMPLWGFDRKTGEFVHNQPHLWPSNWRQGITVHRLDAARDIYSPFAGFCVQSLVPIKKPHFTVDTLVRNGGEVQTISWGKKNNVRHNFYNRSLCHQKDKRGGWFRFEIQTGTHYLKANGISTLEDITDEKVFGLLWHRWEVSNLDIPISLPVGTANLVEELQKHLSGIQIQTFLGLAVSSSSGLPIDMNPRTIKFYRDIGNKCGFLLGQSLDTYGLLKVYINFSRGEVFDVIPNSPIEFTETTMDFSENIEETIGA